MRVSRSDRAIGSAVAVRAFLHGKPDELLGTGDEVVELLRLSGEELLVVGVGDQQRAS